MFFLTHWNLSFTVGLCKTSSWIVLFLTKCSLIQDRTPEPSCLNFSLSSNFLNSLAQFPYVPRLSIWSLTTWDVKLYLVRHALIKYFKSRDIRLKYKVKSYEEHGTKWMKDIIKCAYFILPLLPKCQGMIPAQTTEPPKWDEIHLSSIMGGYINFVRTLLKEWWIWWRDHQTQVLDKAGTMDWTSETKFDGNRYKV